MWLARKVNNHINAIYEYSYLQARKRRRNKYVTKSLKSQNFFETISLELLYFTHKKVS